MPTRAEAAANQFDQSFGSGGKVFYSTVAGTAASGDMEIQPDDGKAVVFGMQGFEVARFNVNGTPDNTFDGDGLAQVPSLSQANALAIQADGKIVVAGRSNADMALARFNSNGSLDTTFDGGGIATLVLPDNENLLDIAIQPDGKIIATGNTRNTGQNCDVAIVRYNPNGSLDTSFDGNGIATTNDAAFDEITAAALQPDGKIIFSERRAFTVSALIRFNPNGSLDTSFHGDGILTFPASNFTNTFARAVAIQPDGKIIISGQQGPDIFLSRLLGDPRQSFKNFNGIFRLTAPPTPIRPACLQIIRPSPTSTA